ncbi:Arm DNA-binding domain-containing protein [Brevibacillus brevis]|uniref:Arm DNA-binding domain-containing protein n=1 Tax=Brevibacillus brevis TaxID=1393 RepID=UPI00064F68E8|nr:Arm DNA-binding domain-containing protein [Brevibacillus brevis]
MYATTETDRQTGTYKEKTKGGFKTKKEAQLAATKEESKINLFGFAENGSERVDNFFDDWLEIYKRPNVKPITYTLQ